MDGFVIQRYKDMMQLEWRGFFIWFDEQDGLPTGSSNLLGDISKNEGVHAAVPVRTQDDQVGLDFIRGMVNDTAGDVSYRGGVNVQIHLASASTAFVKWRSR